MGRQITARQAADLAGISKSQIHRDAAAGKLPVARTLPGYNGPRLFVDDTVRKVYGVAE